MIGTQKQSVWADKIKNQKRADLDDFLAGTPRPDLLSPFWANITKKIRAGEVQTAIDEIFGIEDAAWWIEFREKSILELIFCANSRIVVIRESIWLEA